MGIKLFGFLLFIAAFMDPCDKKPKVITLQQVPEACSTEVGRMYVRVKAPLKQVMNIPCGDAPGGRRCELLMEDPSGSDQLQVFVRGAQDADGLQNFQSTLIAPKGTQNDPVAPYKVPFDAAKLYDRDGRVVDHIKGEVDLSGSLQLNKDTQRCSLLVLHVENTSE